MEENENITEIDVDDLWLRDLAAQMLAELERYLAASGEAPNLAKSVTLTQARFFMDDFHPYEGERVILA